MRNLAVPQEKGKGEIKEGNEESGQFFLWACSWKVYIKFQIQTNMAETTIFNPLLDGTHCDLVTA